MSSNAPTVCSTPRTNTISKTKTARTTQIIFAVMLLLGLALYFWADSRYPSLVKKLHSGTAISVKGAISFDALFPVDPKSPVFTRIVRTTVNWVWTNRIGMSFGIGFGAALLTLIPLFSRRRFKSPVANTLLGAFIGTPLGVCANCVAPIGRGLYSAGASTETVLATMISSPLLNVVVMAMVFSLFPTPLALTRLAIPILLLVLVPFITPPAVQQVAEVQCSISVDADWRQSAGGTLRSFARNLARIFIFTVPLMFVAAALGATGAELLPASSIPLAVSVPGIVIVAVMGTFIPVPMAFDAGLAFVLMKHGVALPYVATLLCTLGGFSIYPFMIVGRTVSWGTAIKLSLAIVVLGVLAGLGTAIFYPA
jgi:uncharacterized membrane protein YraQ (UPF0718 family)